MAQKTGAGRRPFSEMGKALGAGASASDRSGILQGPRCDSQMRCTAMLGCLGEVVAALIQAFQQKPDYYGKVELDQRRSSNPSGEKASLTKAGKGLEKTKALAHCSRTPRRCVLKAPQPFSLARSP